MSQDEVSLPIYQRTSTREQKDYDSLHKPSINSRGTATPDPFHTQHLCYYLETQKPLSHQELMELKFAKTSSGVYYRKQETQGSTVGVEVKDRNLAVGLKTTSHYLAEGFRTAGIELRNMQADLASLKKLMAKQQFQQTGFIA